MYIYTKFRYIVHLTVTMGASPPLTPRRRGSSLLFIL
nr:MAG TPA: hypothetical protein [Caudoviricetes sp.]